VLQQEQGVGDQVGQALSGQVVLEQDGLGVRDLAEITNGQWPG
jgi:hypothetical protein